MFKRKKMCYDLADIARRLFENKRRKMFVYTVKAEEKPRGGLDYDLLTDYFARRLENCGIFE